MPNPDTSVDNWYQYMKNGSQSYLIHQGYKELSFRSRLFSPLLSCLYLRGRVSLSCYHAGNEREYYIKFAFKNLFFLIPPNHKEWIIDESEGEMFLFAAFSFRPLVHAPSPNAWAYKKRRTAGSSSHWNGESNWGKEWGLDVPHGHCPTSWPHQGSPINLSTQKHIFRQEHDGKLWLIYVGFPLCTKWLLRIIRCIIMHSCRR